jgi:hypothetical protein
MTTTNLPLIICNILLCKIQREAVVDTDVKDTVSPLWDWQIRY